VVGEPPVVSNATRKLMAYTPKTTVVVSAENFQAA
jgi:hypothetical protein